MPPPPEAPVAAQQLDESPQGGVQGRGGDAGWRPRVGPGPVRIWRLVRRENHFCTSASQHAVAIVVGSRARFYIRSSVNNSTNSARPKVFGPYEGESVDGIQVKPREVDDSIRVGVVVRRPGRER